MRQDLLSPPCTALDLLSARWRSVLRKQPERRPEAEAELMPLALTAVALYRDEHLRHLTAVTLCRAKHLRRISSRVEHV